MENPINTEYKRENDGTFAKGTAPGPGRPKGKTMKEFARDFLLNKTEEEKIEWLSDLPKEVVWRMAEGNPKQDTDSNINLNAPGIIRLDE